MKDDMPKKVEIKPSYEWAEEAREKGVTHRELEVFALAAEGFTNKEIATILHINHQSVKNHMHNFTKKLDVKNNMQALIIALHLNLVKAQANIGGYTVQYDLENMLKYFRDLFNGKTWSSEIDEKDKKYIKVFLLSHGIDVDKLMENSEKPKDEKS